MTSIGIILIPESSVMYDALDEKNVGNNRTYNLSIMRIMLHSLDYSFWDDLGTPIIKMCLHKLRHI